MERQRQREPWKLWWIKNVRKKFFKRVLTGFQVFSGFRVPWQKPRTGISRKANPKTILKRQFHW